MAPATFRREVPTRRTTLARICDETILFSRLACKREGCVRNNGTRIGARNGVLYRAPVVRYDLSSHEASYWKELIGRPPASTIKPKVSKALPCLPRLPPFWRGPVR
jgi:hypothetical protein